MYGQCGASKEETQLRQHLAASFTAIATSLDCLKAADIFALRQPVDQRRKATGWTNFSTILRGVSDSPHAENCTTSRYVGKWQHVCNVLIA